MRYTMRGTVLICGFVGLILGYCIAQRTFAIPTFGLCPSMAATACPSCPADNGFACSIIPTNYRTCIEDPTEPPCADTTIFQCEGFPARDVDCMDADPETPCSVNKDSCTP